MKMPNYRFLIGFPCLIASMSMIKVAQSQDLPLIPDASLGTEIRSNSDSSQLIINGGLQIGSNLFHSFNEFNIDNAQQVFFSNPADVDLILSRVTGTNLSRILGTLGTLQKGPFPMPGTADLFLFNPNGILFGPNAQLSLGGSFIASTAEQVIFQDGSVFSTTDSSQTPVLTMTVPVGLQFGKAAAPITIQESQLAVAPRQTLGILGGDISIVGGDLPLGANNVFAPGGRAELGSVGPNSTVRLTPVPRGLTFSYELVETFRDIFLSERAAVDVTDIFPILPPPLNMMAIGSGEIQVQGRQLSLTGGAVISSFTLGDISSGDIMIQVSESVELSGGFVGLIPDPMSGMSTFGTPSSGITSGTVGNGNAANITINTQRLLVQDSAAILSTVSVFPNIAPQGQGGTVTINASQSIDVIGSLTILGQSSISSQVSTVGSDEIMTGNAGGINLNTGTLRVLDGGLITTETATGGTGGIVQIFASESIEVSGFGVNSQGEIAPSSLTSLSTSSGDAGTLILQTDTLTVNNQAQITATSSELGNAGDLDIQAQSLMIRDGAEVSVSSFGTSNAGNIFLNITGTENSIFLDNGGQLSATTASGEGGNIVIQNPLGLLVLGGSSSITTTAAESGNGGNITIDSQLVLLADGSSIVANAEAGAGGNIIIQTLGLFVCSTCTIDASSELGVDGIVAITRPETDPETGLIDFPENVLDVSNLVAQGCSGSGDFASGEFTLTGRGGISPSPPQTIDLANVLVDFGETPVEQIRPYSQVVSSPRAKRAFLKPNGPRISSIVEARSWIRDQDGKVILIMNSSPISPNHFEVSPTCHGSPLNEVSSFPFIPFAVSWRGDTR